MEPESIPRMNHNGIPIHEVAEARHQCAKLNSFLMPRYSPWMEVVVPLLHEIKCRGFNLVFAENGTKYTLVDCSRITEPLSSFLPKKMAVKWPTWTFLSLEVAVTYYLLSHIPRDLWGQWSGRKVEKPKPREMRSVWHYRKSLDFIVRWPWLDLSLTKCHTGISSLVSLSRFPHI